MENIDYSSLVPGMDFLRRFMFVEYTVAVMALTLAIRLYVPKLASSFGHAKWLTAIVGAVLGAVGIAFHPHLLTGEDAAANVFRMIISFSFSKIGYDYFVKVVMDRFKIVSSDKKQDINSTLPTER